MKKDLLTPMEPILTKDIIEDSEWIHEIKWDGIRGITYVEDEEVRIFTKNGNERTQYYPEILDIGRCIKANQVVLDGEIVVIDNNRPSFSKIMIRERIKKLSNMSYYTNKYPVKYIVFDILFKNNSDLRMLPLNKRKKILAETLIPNSIITYVDEFTNGTALYELMKQRNYEGIVSKNINSPYIPKKNHKAWFKTKISKKMLVVIGGISLNNGYPNSLLMGIYEDSELINIGRVSSGLKDKDLAALNLYKDKLAEKQSPFQNLKKSKDVIWIKPLLTCYVSFMEWNSKGGLRHPRLIGFSNEPPENANGSEATIS